MKKYYPIAGMHCRSCELVIEQHIRNAPGVETVHVDHRTGIARVTYHNGVHPDDDAIARAVQHAGYRVGTGTRPDWISRNSDDWHEALIAVSIIFILYLAYKILGLDGLGSQITTTVGPASALAVGLVAGISTCMALVGGMVLGISSAYAQRNPSATWWQKFQPQLAFNVGRLGSFALLGGVIGALGSGLRITGGVLGTIIMVAGLTMLVMGLKLIGLFPRIQSFALPSGIGRLVGLGRAQDTYGHAHAALTGALTFLVPCGFTQAMQIYAISTGSFTKGATVMTVFAIGTLPGLLSIGGLSSFARGAGGRMFFRVAGIAVLLLGAWNVSNGWNLTGIILSPIKADTQQAQTIRTATAVLRDGKQYVAMEQSTFGYSLDRITIKRGVPFVWNITSTNAYTCASSLMVPVMNIAATLRAGSNSIEFTPTRAGQIRFSCSMGMYRGIIDVIN